VPSYSHTRIMSPNTYCLPQNYQITPDYPIIPMPYCPLNSWRLKRF